MLCRTAKIVLMEMKPAQQKQHEDQARQRPKHNRVDGFCGSKAVGNQVKKRNPQHQARDQTQYHLRPGMGHHDQPWQATAQQ